MIKGKITDGVLKEIICRRAIQIVQMEATRTFAATGECKLNVSDAIHQAHEQVCAVLSLVKELMVRKKGK